MAVIGKNNKLGEIIMFKIKTIKRALSFLLVTTLMFTSVLTGFETIVANAVGDMTQRVGQPSDFNPTTSIPIITVDSSEEEITAFYDQYEQGISDPLIEFYMDLTAQEQEKICTKYFADDALFEALSGHGLSLDMSIRYVMVMNSHGLSLEEVSQGAKAFGDIELLAAELNRLAQARINEDYPEETLSAARQLILYGLEFANAVRTYAAACVMGVEIDEVLDHTIKDTAQNYLSSNLAHGDFIISEMNNALNKLPPIVSAEEFIQMFQKQDIAINSVESLSETYNLQQEALESYLEDNQLSADAFNFLVDEEIAAFSGTQTTSVTTSNLTSGKPIDRLITAPFSFEMDEYGGVNMNTGEYTYEETDLVLPGKNGLDLVLQRRFDLSESSPYYPIAWIIDTSLPVYTLRYAFYFSDEKEYICSPSQRIQPSQYGNYNWSWNSELVWDREKYMQFSADLIDMAGYNEDIFYWKFDEFRAYRTIVYNLSTGRVVPILAKPEITINETNLKRTTFNELFTDEDDVKRYGLGNGWRYAFSSIEEYGQLVDESSGILQYTSCLMLKLADGRKYKINFDKGDTATLEGYKLNDLVLKRDSGGHPGAVYTLTYADGKREFFDEGGFLLAIKDKFDNAITFSYVKIGSGYHASSSKMTITDTLGRQVVYEGSPTNPNQRILTAPDGSQKIFTSDYVRPNSTSSTKGYRRLLSMVDDENNTTTYTTGGKSICSNAFSDYLFPANDTYQGSYYQPYLSSVAYSNGMILNYSIEGGTRLINNGIGSEEYIRLRDRYVTIPAQHHTLKPQIDKVLYEFYWYSGNYTGYGDTNVNSGDYARGYEYVFSTGKQLAYWYYGERSNARMPAQETVCSFNQTQKKSREKMSMGWNEFPYENTLDRLLDLEDERYMITREKEFTYNNYDLVSSVLEKDYDYLTGNENKTGPYIQRNTYYVYDNKGNVIRYTGPDGNSVDMTFDTSSFNFNMPLTKTYKKDANTTILEKNTLSFDGKKIIATEVFENNVLKQKTEYQYDNAVPGNVIRERRYKDGFVNYEDTVYSYIDNQTRAVGLNFNGAYVTTQTIIGALDSTGGYAISTPGHASGTIINECYYDVMGRLETSIDTNGASTLYQYDGLGNITCVTNPDGTFSEYDRDYVANTLTVMDEEGHQVEHRYNKLGKLETVIDVETEQPLSAYWYDSLARVHEERVYSSSDTWKSAVYTYEMKGNRPLTIKTYDQDGTLLYHESYVYHDAFQNTYEKVTKTVHGDANAPDVVTTEYKDKMGNVVKQGAFLGGVEYFDTFEYDYLGNKIQALSALDASQNRPFTAKWEYDYAGRVTKETNTLNQSSFRTYDALGRNISVTDYAGNVSTFTYDALGRLLKQETPFEQIGSTVYNAVKTYDYDPAGNVIREQTQNNASGTAPSWAKTEYIYNNRGFLTAADSYNGAAVANRVEYTYDAVGHMLTQKTGASGGSPAVTSYTYDRFGNPLTLTDALGQSESYTYDLAGNVTEKTDRNGALTGYTYDGLGRPLLTTVTQDSELTGRTGFTYTMTGQMRTLSNDDHTATYSYDTLGRLVTESETGGVAKGYTYDIGGNRTGFTLVVNNVPRLNTTYTYDALNRLQIVNENGKPQATYTYDTNGNRAGLTAENGVKTTYTYNRANLVTSLQNKSKTNTIQSSFAYSYYLDGNQKSKTDHEGRTTHYTYDGLGRLVSEAESGASDAKSYTYTYDARNNRNSLTVIGAENYVTAYAYDINDRLLETVKMVGGVDEVTSYHYDPNGNTISTMVETFAPVGTDPAELSLGGGGYELSEYDGFNQLVKTTKDGVVTEYTYKPDGLRLSKNDTTHIWDGQNIVAELDGNIVTVVYIRGINLICDLYSGDRTFYSYNAHGDVVQLTNAYGNVTKDYRYDAFGVEQNINESDTNPWRYCGEYWDVETGTVYLRARYYDPVVGRFTQQDTTLARRKDLFDPYGDYQETSLVGGVLRDKEKNQFIVNDPLSLNLYTYCHSNPLMYSDPSGHSIIIAGVSVSLGTILAAGLTLFLIYDLIRGGPFIKTFSRAIYDLGMSVVNALKYAKKLTPPSKLRNGDKVKTPDTHPEEFQKNKDGSYTHKKTGWTASKDKSGHRGAHWDMSPPRESGHINVDPNGKVI